MPAIGIVNIVIWLLASLITLLEKGAFEHEVAAVYSPSDTQ
jgi:hypothetical protein